MTDRFYSLLTQGTGISRTIDPRLEFAARYRAQEAAVQVGYDSGAIPHPPQAERLARLGWDGHGTAELATWNYLYHDPVQAAVDGLLGSSAHRAVLDNPIWKHWGAGIFSTYKPGDDTSNSLLARHYFLIWLSTGVPAMKAIVYNGDSAVDAVSASYLVSKYASPIFPIAKSSVPAQVRSEIAARKPQEILIVGGTGVVDGAAEAILRQIAPTRRVAGATRYDTAVAVSRA